MDQNFQTPRRGRAGKLAVGGGMLAAGALAGAILAGTMSASADTTPTPSSSASSSATQDSTGSSQSGGGVRQGGPGGMRDHGGATPVRGDEKAVSTDVAAKLEAAALAAVPGGTVYRVETDAGDANYEAHMTKADGTLVTVKFDQNLAVTGTQDGMGKGDPAPSGTA